MEDIKITSETKQKNPKRVEQGKWLGSISKGAKEKKARERFLAEQEMEKEEYGSSKYIIGLILVASAGLYYVYEKYKNEYKVKRKQQSEHKVQSEQPKKSEQGERLVNLFD